MLMVVHDQIALPFIHWFDPITGKINYLLTNGMKKINKFICSKILTKTRSAIIFINPIQGRESRGLNDGVHGILCRYSDKTGKKINHISTNTYSIFHAIKCTYLLIIQGKHSSKCFSTIFHAIKCTYLLIIQGKHSSKCFSTIFHAIKCTHLLIIQGKISSKCFSTIFHAIKCTYLLIIQGKISSKCFSTKYCNFPLKFRAKSKY